MTTFTDDEFRDDETLILGWSGFIGSSLRTHLEKLGRPVVGIGRSAFETPLPRIDTSNPGWLLRILESRPITSVVNALGNVSSSSARALHPESWEQIRIGFSEATRRLAGLKVLVHIGSAAEYGSGSTPYKESDWPRPNSDYGREKLKETIFFSALAEHGVNVVIVRPSNVVGANLRGGMLLPSALRAISRKEKISVTDPIAIRNYVYVADVVDAISKITLRQAPLPNILNLGSSYNFSTWEILEELALSLGVDVESFATKQSKISPLWNGNSPADCLTVNSDLAASELGLGPGTEMQEAFRQIGREIGLLA